jgi:VWFA-related protein
MLLFSDGADTSSWLTPARVIETARRTDVVVYPVGVRSQVVLLTAPPGRAFGEDSIGRGVRPLSQTLQIEQAGKFLTALADATGGRVMMAGADSDLRETFVKTLAEFRDRYVLTYEPTGVRAGGWHPIDVKLKGKRGKITARRGYFAQ